MLWQLCGTIGDLTKADEALARCPSSLPPSLPPSRWFCFSRQRTCKMFTSHPHALSPFTLPPPDFPPTPYDIKQILQGRDSTKGPRAPGRSNRDDETSSKYSHGTSKLSNSSTAAGEGVNGNDCVPLYVCTVHVCMYSMCVCISQP